MYFFKESGPLLLEMKTLVFSLSEHLEMFLFDSLPRFAESGAHAFC